MALNACGAAPILIAWAGLATWLVKGGYFLPAEAVYPRNHSRTSPVAAGCARRVCSPAPLLLLSHRSPADSSRVYNHRDNQDHEIHAFDWPVRIHQPGVANGGQGQQKESQDGQKQSVVCPFQVIRKQEHAHQHDAWKRQDGDQQRAARHNVLVRF